MFENPRKYFIENVFMSYEEFLNHRSSNEWGENQLVRKGINSANALFHLREHLPSNIRPTKTTLKRQCPDYGLVADIANVAKHYEISRDNPRITKASQIYELTIITEFTDEQGIYYSPQLEVIIKLDDGTEIKLVDILYNVMRMWCDIFDNLGIIKMKEINPPEINMPVTREEANKRMSNISVFQGEDWKFIYQFAKYNYEKKIAEPIDLTDCKAEFRLYKLPEQVPMRIHMCNAASEFDIDFDLSLSEDQAVEYMSLEDNKKLNFLKQIVDKNTNLKAELVKQIRSAIEAHSIQDKVNNVEDH